MTGFGSAPATRDAHLTEPRCPTPSKRRYYSRREAKTARTSLAAKSSTDGLHAYRCDCGCWHLGHRPGTRTAIHTLPTVECAKRFRRPGYSVNCPAPGTHKLETAAGDAWLCETHWLELTARVRARRAA